MAEKIVEKLQKKSQKNCRKTRRKIVEKMVEKFAVFLLFLSALNSVFYYYVLGKKIVRQKRQ
jgi:hypothetical protein